MQCYFVPLLLILVWSGPPLPGAVSEGASTLCLKKVFHITGAPGIPRNERLDLVLSTESLVLQRGAKKLVLSVPFSSIRRIQLLRGERHYPGATYAAAVAGGFAGALLILKKRKVDMIVVDYVNERGGAMGLVLQTPLFTGAQCRRWLEKSGLQVEEPPPPPEATLEANWELNLARKEK